LNELDTEKIAFTRLDDSDGSSLMGFLQTGTGAVLQTLQTKVREFVNVKDFGVVGDGITDDTAAIQLAFNTLGVSSNSLMFPYGTYKVTDTITMSGKESFSIFGKGRISQTVANKPIFSFTSCSHFDISGLFLYGLGTDYVASSDTSLGIGIILDTCAFFDITSCIFKNFGYAAVQCSGNCTNFSITKNKVLGTDGITSAITSGDIYQFAFIFKSGAGLAFPNTDFIVSENNIQKTAMGIRTEPLSTRYQISDNVLYDLQGEHGFYLNGTRFSVTDNVIRSVPFIGIKLQSFQHTGLGVSEAILNAVVSGNNIYDCTSGITVEKTSDLAANSSMVTIMGNTIFSGSTSSGTGIGVYDLANFVISGNVTFGCAYGIFAGLTTANNGCSGKIIGNRVVACGWAGIAANPLELLTIEGNELLRPCLAALTSENQRAAIYALGAFASIRLNISGNTLVTGTSTGVVNGLYLNTCDVALGNNDLEAKPITTVGATLRKRVLYGDYSSLVLWSAIGSVAANAVVTKNITVTGVVLSDTVVSASIASDLKGCTLTGYVSAVDTVTFVISNNTGSSQTISDGFVRYNVMRFAI
jgi:hypothetical protein